MEKLIDELKKLNQVVADCNQTLGAIIEELKKVIPDQQTIWGSESDIKNTDSNVDRED